MMNRCFLLFSLAMMLFAASCSKTSFSHEEEVSGSKSVSIHPQLQRLPATKVSFKEDAYEFFDHLWDPWSFGFTYPLDWDANDAIWVINSQQPKRLCGYIFTGSYWSLSGEEEVEKDPSVAVQQFYGVYPQNDISIASVTPVTADSTYATITATIPAVQSISKDYYLMTSAVDVPALADSIVMPFKTVNTVIRIGFNNQSGRSIILRGMSLSSDLPLAGTFAVNISTNGYVEYLDPDGDGDVSDPNMPRSYSVSLDLGDDDAVLEVVPFTDNPDYNFKEFYILPQKYIFLTLTLKLEVDGELRNYVRKIYAEDENDEVGDTINWIPDPNDPENQLEILREDGCVYPAYFYTPGNFHYIDMGLG